MYSGACEKLKDITFFNYLSLEYRAYFALPHEYVNFREVADMSGFLDQLYCQVEANDILTAMVDHGFVYCSEYTYVRRHYDGYYKLAMPGNWQQRYCNDVAIVLAMNIFRISESLKLCNTVAPYAIDFSVHFDGMEMGLNEFKHLYLQS